MVGIILTPEQIRSAAPVDRARIGRLARAEARRGECRSAAARTFGGMHIGGSSGGFVLDPGHVSSRQCILRTRAARRKCRKRRARSVPAGRYLAATRLQNMSQVIAFLDIINQAVRRVRADPAATLYVLDSRGDCIVAAQTQQNVSRLWHQVIGGPESSGEQVAQSGGTKAEASVPETGPSGLQDREATRSADAL